ncbi:MAG: phosphoribosyl-ATP diphosphatase [Arenicellales bacterium]|jgi:phosphoribosyl-ATP pyrophosphohydrolase|nr:phosphoribosyl-ATP diphosphatase [Arenicellales bacterium]MDP7521677.1 phosphoribosyl-ATP diphosphatase [Arenicellales bacterium]|tara:strand:+ start:1013 stop:1327 length:315 start_codon:yes stop_codon:yes gene_type:complete
MSDTLERVATTIKARQGGDPKNSYVAQLEAAGLDAILKKIGEECAEVLIAAKGEKRQQVVYETADLWFHTLVMLAHMGLGPEDVLVELERREGISGLTEKSMRE